MPAFNSTHLCLHEFIHARMHSANIDWLSTVCRTLNHRLHIMFASKSNKHKNFLLLLTHPGWLHGFALSSCLAPMHLCSSLCWPEALLSSPPPLLALWLPSLASSGLPVWSLYILSTTVPPGIRHQQPISYQKEASGSFAGESDLMAL